MEGGSVNAPKARDLLSNSWWWVPSLLMAGLSAAAILMTRIDRWARQPPDLLAFSGGAAEARQVLSNMGSAVLTFTGLTFSIAIVVLTLISGQLSPRVLRTFLRDRPTKTALGVFVGTYLYLLIALHQVRGTDAAGSPVIPRMTITVAFLLTAASVLLFVYFIHHIGQSVRASSIINRTATETRRSIERTYPAPRGPEEHRSEGGKPPSPAAEPLQVIHAKQPRVRQSHRGSEADRCGHRRGLCPGGRSSAWRFRPDTRSPRPRLCWVPRRAGGKDRPEPRPPRLLCAAGAQSP
jgi:uncharacterized membrane protein